MTPTIPCPACAARRLHTPADWLHHHPHAGHGFNGTAWTHPDLPAGPQSFAGGVTVSQPGEVCLAAPPAGDEPNCPGCGFTLAHYADDGGIGLICQTPGCDLAEIEIEEEV